MDEVGYINQSAVASALTYATNRGVTIMMLCSPVDASHWLSKMGEITNGDDKGVCLISLQYLCADCADMGKTGICIHGSLILPWHIEAGDEIEEDPVRQIMDKVSPGSYQQEICGYNEHTQARETEVFSQKSLKRLTSDNWLELTENDQNSVDSILLSMDPVQAGSSVSGIGLAVVVQMGEVYMVSIDPMTVLAFSLARSDGNLSDRGISFWSIDISSCCRLKWGCTSMGLSIDVGNMADTILHAVARSNVSVCKPLLRVAKS